MFRLAPALSSIFVYKTNMAPDLYTTILNISQEQRSSFVENEHILFNSAFKIRCYRLFSSSKTLFGYCLYTAGERDGETIPRIAT